MSAPFIMSPEQEELRPSVEESGEVDSFNNETSQPQEKSSVIPIDPPGVVGCPGLCCKGPDHFGTAIEESDLRVKLGEEYPVQENHFEESAEMEKPGYFSWDHQVWIKGPLEVSLPEQECMVKPELPAHSETRTEEFKKTGINATVESDAQYPTKGRIKVPVAEELKGRSLVKKNKSPSALYRGEKEVDTKQMKRKMQAKSLDGDGKWRQKNDGGERVRKIPKRGGLGHQLKEMGGTRVGTVKKKVECEERKEGPSPAAILSGKEKRPRRMKGRGLKSHLWMNRVFVTVAGFLMFLNLSTSVVQGLPQTKRFVRDQGVEIICVACLSEGCADSVERVFNKVYKQLWSKSKQQSLEPCSENSLKESRLCQSNKRAFLSGKKKEDLEKVQFENGTEQLSHGIEACPEVPTYVTPGRTEYISSPAPNSTGSEKNVGIIVGIVGIVGIIAVIVIALGVQCVKARNKNNESCYRPREDEIL